MPQPFGNITDMQLKLIDEEMQEVCRISANCTEAVDSLCQRLEMLTWGDGLLEFRMQAGVGLLPWMEQLQNLSDQINKRLYSAGIPFGPTLEAYQECIGSQKAMKLEKESREALKRFVTDNRNLEELEQKIFRFNIFEATGMVRQEIKYSNFIQFLLSPSEKHCLGDAFFKEILVQTLRDSEDTSLDALKVATLSFQDAEVRREWKNIDLLIHSSSNCFVCVIENKVDSSEGFDQLYKYESVIEKAFPDCQKVFVFLTKEGYSASRSKWLSLSYASIADILETICEEQKSNICDEIHIPIRHYIDLIRRHIMSESDIAQLCRKIYKQHRQAIDLIYEHRPDLRSDIEETLLATIREYSASMNLDKDDSSQKWIRFAPKEWDRLVFQNSCSRWTTSKRILLFEFWNDSKSLQLRLVAGPGEINVKQNIYDKLKEISVSGIRSCKISEAGFNQLCIVPILNQTDYEDRSLEEIQERIKSFWVNYSNGDMKVIREAIFKSFKQKPD